jgi:hypothetical protein
MDLIPTNNAVDLFHRYNIIIDNTDRELITQLSDISHQWVENNHSAL